MKIEYTKELAPLLRPSHHNALNLTGMRFGRLVVLTRSNRESPTKKSKRAFWICQCDCGNKTVASTANLRKGHILSCGCYRIERTKEIRRAEALARFGKSSKNRSFQTYKRNARKRGYPFDISFDQFLELSQKECFYCGAKPSNCQKSECGNGDFTYNGIDRINNSKGYMIGNVVPCCRMCNQAKWNRDVETFFGWIHRVAKKHPQP